MSAQLVMAGPGQPVVHNAFHDLELFFYVLVGVCVLYDGPSMQKSEANLAECCNKLFSTFEPSILKTMLDSWIRQLESDVRNYELQCYRAYKHTWSPMSETKEH
jgi:hypothetical protein